MAKINTDKVQREFEKDYLKETTEFSVGDTIDVAYRIEEGGKTRVQKFRGIVIATKNSGSRKTFTVRKISSGIGVERIFPVNSPNIAGIEMIKSTDVKKSKLYYMRKRTGKAASKVD